MGGATAGLVTVVTPQEAAGLCGSGQKNLKVHLLQNPLIQLDLRVRHQVLAQQNHGPAGDRRRPRLDLGTGETHGDL